MSFKKTTIKLSAILSLTISFSYATDSVIEPSATILNGSIDPYMTDTTRSITSYGETIIGGVSGSTGENTNLLGDFPSSTPSLIDADMNGQWDGIPWNLPKLLTWDGTKYVANGYYTTVIGDRAQADSYGTTAVGANSLASGLVATAYGFNAIANNHYTTAVGYAANAAGLSSTAIGSQAGAVGDWSTAIGTLSISHGYGSVSIGLGSRTYNNQSVAIGQEATAIAVGSAAIGYNATANGANSVALGSGSTTVTGSNEISVGDAASSLTRRITNVATPIAATDATNKSYVDQAILNINAGGGMDYTYADMGDQAVRDYADQGDTQTLQSANDYTDSKVTSLKNEISDIKHELRKEIHESTALALALSTPAVIENGKDNAMSLGVGQYKSAAAIGISYSRRATRDTFVNFGVSVVGQNVASRASYNLSF